MKRLSLLIAVLIALGLVNATMAKIDDWSETAASNNTAAPDGFPENMSPGSVNDAAREVMAQVRRLAAQTVSGTYAHDSGSADAYIIIPPIPPAALLSGQVFRFKANASSLTTTPTLTVNGLGAITMVKFNSLALVAGDIGANTIHEVVYNGANFQLMNPVNSISGGLIQASQITGSVNAGRHTIWIPAGAMISRSSTGAAITSVELSSNLVMLNALGFDGSVDEFAQFQIGMPTSWDEGPIGAIPVWTAQSGSGTVTFNVQCVSFGDSDPFDAAFGPAVGVTDTVLTIGDVHFAAEISPITISTAVENDLLACQVYRDADIDTHAADAELIGLKVIYIIDEPNDN